jgi:2,3-diaminopropionate biosynthesis protein SbnA
MDIQAILSMEPRHLVELLNRIGNTPLRLIYLVINGVARKVYLKLEGENPAGSVKDRTAYALIRQLEAQGKLGKDSVIIESTSGNLGVALALICRARKYRFIAVVDPKSTQENVSRMRALGAEIDEVHEADESGGYLLARLKRVRELCGASDGYIWTDQYSNEANPQAHYSGTAPEIYHQMDGRVDAVFAAVSTGGTLAGIGRFFREFSPSTHIIGVDVQGSVVFGGQSGPRRLTGIGSAKPSTFITRELYDSHLLVTDEAAFASCRALLDATGIKVGGSSGAVLSACAKYLQTHPDITCAACLCADRGDNYSSTIFNDAWLEQQGIDLSSVHLEGIEDILLEAPSPYEVTTI